MNAGWNLRVALVCCGALCGGRYFAAGALGQSQFSQPPASASARIVAQQQNPQYASQFQAASAQPTLPPANASAFGQQQYSQPAAQSYPQGSSFGQQPRSSVFSAQPTYNTSAQGWNNSTSASDPRYAADPRYTAATANDPRYSTQTQTDPRYASAPQLSPPENSTLQQYANQLGTAAPQFSNTLRDAQQYGQQAQQFGQTARDWQQQAQQFGQQAQQLGQQVQPYLSSLTNNPYAYVPPPPQTEPAANQYLAASSQTADNQFGRSVLVNNQQPPASSFGQYTGGQYGAGGTQYASPQQPQQSGSSFDPRGQLYQPETPADPRLAGGPSAFTSSGLNSSSGSAQDPRLMQPPTLSDPRYAQATDPRTVQDPRALALEPPLSSTLPGGATGQLASPYENVQTPRADGQNNAGGSLNPHNAPPQNNATTSFASGTKTEVPSLFTNVLPTTVPQAGQPFGAGNNSLPAGQAGQTPIEPDKAHLWNVLIGCLVVTFASIGANFYFGWNFTEYYFRYRRLLVEGDDDDRSRSRDDDHDRRR